MQDWTESGTSLRSQLACKVREARKVTKGSSLQGGFKDRVGVADDNRVATLIDFVITTEKASGRRMDLNTLRLSSNLSSIHMG